MVGTTSSLSDLEAKAEAGERFTRQEAERVLACVDLVSVGLVGEGARRQGSGDVVTFGSVWVSGGQAAQGQAGELRITNPPASIDAALAEVRRVAAVAGGLPVTGFATADLLALSGHDLGALCEMAGRFREAGLEAVAETAVDRFETTRDAIDAIGALMRGGLGVWRLTVDRAALDVRLDLAERAAAIQDATQSVRAYAPLPRLDPADLPSTGYDDVRTVAVARIVCRDIEAIQVDWPLYGPKLAQVALAYGANDIDGVAAVETQELGPRRAPREDIARQIRAAGGRPIERNGRYERLS